jgi:hypothetical protein
VVTRPQFPYAKKHCKINEKSMPSPRCERVHADSELYVVVSVYVRACARGSDAGRSGANGSMQFAIRPARTHANGLASRDGRALDKGRYDNRLLLC